MAGILEIAAGAALVLMGALRPTDGALGLVVWGLFVVASGIGLYLQVGFARAASIIASVPVALLAMPAVPIAASWSWFAFAFLAVSSALLVLFAVRTTPPRERLSEVESESRAVDGGIVSVGASPDRSVDLAAVIMLAYIAVWLIPFLVVFSVAGFATFLLVAGINGQIGFPETGVTVSPWAYLAMFLAEGGVIVGVSAAITILVYRFVLRLLPPSIRRWIPWRGSG